jgi:hypothetical protein
MTINLLKSNLQMIGVSFTNIKLFCLYERRIHLKSKQNRSLLFIKMAPKKI